MLRFKVEAKPHLRSPWGRTAISDISSRIQNLEIVDGNDEPLEVLVLRIFCFLILEELFFDAQKDQAIGTGREIFQKPHVTSANTARSIGYSNLN